MKQPTKKPLPIHKKQSRKKKESLSLKKIFMEAITTRLLFCPLFKGITPDEIEKLIREVETHKKKHNQGELLAQRGDLYESLMIVLNGAVIGEMMDSLGKVVKIEELKSGMPLATAVLYSQSPRLPVNITTLQETEILYIPKASFTIMMQKNNTLLINFLQLVSNRATFLTERIWFLSFKTIREKLAHFFLQKATQGSDRIKIELTQQEIADYFGVTRPALARSIAKLEEEGIIKMERKEVLILDRNKLTTTANS